MYLLHWETQWLLWKCLFDWIGAEVRPLSFYVSFETTKSSLGFGYFLGLFPRKTVVKCRGYECSKIWFQILDIFRII